jgi:dTDP-4-dehydrorhamnose reductase
MARRVVQHVNPNSAVEPCTTQQFPRPAPRPPYSVLDITETEAVVGPMPHWKQNLSDVLKRIEPST